MIEYNKKNARLWSILGINPAIWSIGFAEVIANNSSISLLTSDVARYSGLTRVFNHYPEMCYNFGISEQNMVSVGAGMAMEGMQVYMTTYAPFMTFRCADQVRHLMGNLNLNMKAIGSAAGFSAGLSGSSLLAINDLALMRSIPNMVVLSPADTMEAIKMIIAMSEIESPCYMRFCGASNLPMVYTDDYKFEIGKAIELVSGQKIAIISTGTTVVSECIKAASLLRNTLGYSPTVVNMHTIKPLDKTKINELLKKHDCFITVEEHNIIGGLGSAVAEHLATTGKQYKQLFIGIEDKNYIMGSREFMLNQANLLANKIANKIIAEL
jgi:transketolase